MKIVKRFIALILIVLFQLTSIIPFTQNVGPAFASESCNQTSSGNSGSSVKSRVGGVALDQAAKFLADMTDITGAYYDQTKDRIVFIGKKNTLAPQLDKDDLAVAIKVIIFEGRLPTFSLDPDPNDNTSFASVYSSNSLVDTKFGKVMFDADYDMKKYVKGYDANGTAIQSNVAGYKSQDQMFIDLLNAGNPVPESASSRFWITPEYISLKKDDASSSFVFDSLKMQVKTEGLLPTNGYAWNKSAEDFAKFQTDHFDQFAQEAPSYAAIKQVGKVAAVVKWIKDSDIATDFYWARDYAPKIVTTPRSIKKFPPRNYTLNNGISGTIVGGADLITPNQYSADTSGTSAAVKTSAQSVATTKEDIHWTFTKDNQPYEAVAVAADAFRSIGSYNTTSQDLSFPIAGDLNLNFTRAYSSYNGGQQGVGRGWSIFPARLMETHVGWAMNCNGVSHPHTLGFNSQSGGWESFVYDCANGYVPEDPAYYSKIFHNSDGTFTAKLKDQTEFNFDSGYTLKNVKDKNGNLINYNYDSSNKLTSITDTKSHIITLSYNAQNWISEATDWSGRKIKYNYDSQGNLLDVTDPNGNQTKFTYDNNFKLIKITDRNNQEILTNTYNDQAKLTSQKNPSDLTNNYAYDDINRSVTITDQNARVYKTIYDQKARILEKIDPLGTSLKYSYGPEFTPKTITDKRGKVVTNTYDTRGNLLSVTYPNGKKISYEYDNLNRLTKTLDGRYGATTKNTIYTYSGANLTEVNEVNLKTTFTHDPTGEILTQTDPLLKKITWTRDTLGNKLTETDPLSNKTTYEYDGIGRLKKITDAENKITNYTYDNNGNLLTENNSIGTVTNNYDKENRVIKTTNPNNSITEYTYNKAGSLEIVKDALTNLTTYGYDNYQNLKTQKNALDKTTQNTYDSLNQLKETKSPLGQTDKWEYDANGNLVKRTDPNGIVTQYTYDDLNIMTKTAYPDGKAVDFTYDDRGNMIKMVDSIGTSTYLYDNFDRLTEAKNPDNNTIKYAYDNKDQLTKITYPDNKAVNYTYFDNGKLKDVTDWNLKKTSYTYYKNGLVATRTYPNTIKTTYNYDSANRLSQVIHTKSTTNVAKYTYERDLAGNIKKVTEEGSYVPTPSSANPAPIPTPIPSPVPVASGPDLVITQMSLNSTSFLPGSEATFTVKIKNQGTTIVNQPAMRIVAYFDLEELPTYITPDKYFDNLTVTLSPGQEKTYSFTVDLTSRLGTHNVWGLVDQDNDAQETNEINNASGPFAFTIAKTIASNISPITTPTQTSSLSSLSISSPLSFFASVPIINDLKNAILNFGVKEAVAVTTPIITTFEYDPLSRIKKALYPNGSNYEYQYDKADNRTKYTFKNAIATSYLDDDNKLKQAGRTLYFYDKNGNVVREKQDTLQEDILLKYDFENRLINYTAPNDLQYAFKYDGLGNRIEKRSYDEFDTTGVHDRFVTDISQPLSRTLTEMYQTNHNSVEKYYVYGLGPINQGDGSSSWTRYYLEDGQGNIRFTTNSSGSKSETFNYNPFGGYLNENIISAESDAQFDGQKFDDETNLYFLRARYYNPETGRFISRDPVKGTLSTPQTQNPYSYAINNPINLSDPSGLAVNGICVSCSGGAGGYVSTQRCIGFGDNWQFGATKSISGGANPNVAAGVDVTWLNSGSAKTMSDLHGTSGVSSLGFNTPVAKVGVTGQGNFDLQTNQVTQTNTGLSFGVGMSPVDFKVGVENTTAYTAQDAASDALKILNPTAGIIFDTISGR